MKTFFKVLFCLFLLTSCGNTNKKEKTLATKDTKAEKTANDSIDRVIKSHKKDFYDFWINMSKMEYYHVSKSLANEQNSAYYSDGGFIELKFELQKGEIKPFEICSDSLKRAGQITFQDNLAIALMTYKPIFQNNSLKAIELDFPPINTFFYDKSADTNLNNCVKGPTWTCHCNGNSIVRLYTSKYGKPTVNIQKIDYKKYSTYKWLKGNIVIKIIIEYEYSRLTNKVGTGIDSKFKTTLLEGGVTDIKIVYVENEYLKNIEKKKLEEENKLKSVKNRELEDIKSNI